MTDVLTVLRAQSGDRDAVDELLRGVQEPLFRYISRLAGDRALAEEVLQEVFILIYRKLRWLDDPSLFRAWTYRIASRETFRMLRRERRWREQVRDEEVLESVAASPPPEPAMLEPIVGQLSPGSRAVVILHYFHDLPLDEIAAVLALPLGTVKSRLHYGLRQLRARLKP